MLSAIIIIVVVGTAMISLASLLQSMSQGHCSVPTMKVMELS